MGSKEAVVEQYLVKRVKEIGGIAYKFTSPGRRSVPDRICVFPTGIVLFVECKASGGVLSAGQKREIERLQELRASVTVVWSKENVDDLLAAVTEARNERL